MSQKQEQKYFEKLDIAVLSISRIKDLLKSDIKNTITAWDSGLNVRKQCFHIIGPAGVGKTEICFQIASELEEELGRPFNIIKINAPVLSRDDFLIPFPVKGANGIHSYKMLYSDFIPDDPDSYGLFVIDEFMRGDHTLQQMLWQAQNEYSIHTHKFPKGWFVISVDNPDDGEYQMDTLEDAAGLRRQLHVYTEVSVHDFLTYAIEQKFHSAIVGFIQTHPDYLYDFDSQKKGSVYANPASWEKLSDHLIKIEKATGSLMNELVHIENLATGLVNVTMTRLFMRYLKDEIDINPKDIFNDFKKVKAKIKKMVDENDNAALGEVMTGFFTFMSTSRPEYKQKELNNVGDFLAMIPVDTAAIFVTSLDKFNRQSPEFKYLINIHTLLSKKHAGYKKFYERICETGDSL